MKRSYDTTPTGKRDGWKGRQSPAKAPFSLKQHDVIRRSHLTLHFCDEAFSAEAQRLRAVSAHA